MADSNIEQCGCEGPSDPRFPLEKYVAVPVTGEWFVRNGKVLQVLESDSVDSSDDLCDAWDVYTVREDNNNDL